VEEKGRAAKRRGEKGERQRGRIGASFVVGVVPEGRGRAGERDGGVPSRQPWPWRENPNDKGVSRLIREENALAGLTNRWHRWVNSLQLSGLGGTCTLE
jgi:hypothetical protein